MKYYLIKATPRIKDIIEFNQIDKCKSCVELTEEELQEIECGMNKNSQEIINNEQLCKIVDKIRKVLDNE